MKDKYEKVIALPASATYLTIDTRDGYKYEPEYPDVVPPIFPPGYPQLGFRDPSQNQFNINIYKNEAMFNGRINRIALQELNMLYSCPNVNPYNNVLYFEEANGADFINRTAIVVPVGWYTGRLLETTLQNLLNNYGPSGLFTWNTWQVKWYQINNSFIIYSGDKSQVFRINPMNEQNKGTYTVAGDSTVYKRTDTLATMMGYASTQMDGGSLAISGVANLQYTTYIDVISNTITSNQLLIDNTTSNTTGRNLLARIYLSKDMTAIDNVDFVYEPTGATGPTGAIVDDTPIGGVPMWINYEPPGITKQIRWDPDVALYGINIQLRDDKGELLYDYKPTSTIVSSLPIGITGGTGPWDYNFSGSSSYAQLSFLISEDE